MSVWGKDEEPWTMKPKGGFYGDYRRIKVYPQGDLPFENGKWMFRVKDGWIWLDMFWCHWNYFRCSLNSWHWDWSFSKNYWQYNWALIRWWFTWFGFVDDKWIADRPEEYFWEPDRTLYPEKVYYKDIDGNNTRGNVTAGEVIL